MRISLSRSLVLALVLALCVRGARETSPRLASRQHRYCRTPSC